MLSTFTDVSFDKAMSIVDVLLEDKNQPEYDPILGPSMISMLLNLFESHPFLV